MILDAIAPAAADLTDEFTKNDLIFLTYALGYFIGKFPTEKHPEVWDKTERMLDKIGRMREKLDRH